MYYGMEVNNKYVTLLSCFRPRKRTLEGPSAAHYYKSSDHHKLKKTRMNYYFRIPHWELCKISYK